MIPPLPPDLEARFEVLSRLGEGGFGVVLRCRERASGRTVAVKRLHRLEPAALARFRREADLTAAVDHPGVVRLLDHGLDAGGEPFLVYEFLEGRTLAEAADRSTGLAPASLLGWGRQLGAALQALHELGVVHRDVKPENLMLACREGEEREAMVLLDLGIARPSSGGAQLTATGVILGTPAFMAPEIWAGAPPSHGSDVWAGFASLWCGLTRDSPYGAEDPASILRALNRGWTGPSCEGLSGPARRLGEVLAAGLAREPSARRGALVQLEMPDGPRSRAAPTRKVPAGTSGNFGAAALLPGSEVPPTELRRRLAGGFRRRLWLGWLALGMVALGWWSAAPVPGPEPPSSPPAPSSPPGPPAVTTPDLSHVPGLRAALNRALFSDPDAPWRWDEDLLADLKRAVETEEFSLALEECFYASLDLADQFDELDAVGRAEPQVGYEDLLREVTRVFLFLRRIAIPTNSKDVFQAVTRPRSTSYRLLERIHGWLVGSERRVRGPETARVAVLFRAATEGDDLEPDLRRLAAQLDGVAGGARCAALCRDLLWACEISPRGLPFDSLEVPDVLDSAERALSRVRASGLPGRRLAAMLVEAEILGLARRVVNRRQPLPWERLDRALELLEAPPRMTLRMLREPDSERGRSEASDAYGGSYVLTSAIEVLDRCSFESSSRDRAADVRARLEARLDLRHRVDDLEARLRQRVTVGDGRAQEWLYQRAPELALGRGRVLVEPGSMQLVEATVAALVDWAQEDDEMAAALAGRPPGPPEARLLRPAIFGMRRTLRAYRRLVEAGDEGPVISPAEREGCRQLLAAVGRRLVDAGRPPGLSLSTLRLGLSEAVDLVPVAAAQLADRVEAGGSRDALSDAVAVLTRFEWETTVIRQVTPRLRDRLRQLVAAHLTGELRSRLAPAARLARLGEWIQALVLRRQGEGPGDPVSGLLAEALEQAASLVVTVEELARPDLRRRSFGRSALLPMTSALGRLSESRVQPAPGGLEPSLAQLREVLDRIRTALAAG